MKFLVLGDLHIGARNNSEVFLNYMDNYFQNELFPYIEKNNIKYVIQLGDTLDKRKSIDFVTANFLMNKWFLEFELRKVFLFTLVGNHDTYYKNTNEISGVAQLAIPYQYTTVVEEPTGIATGVANEKVLMVPWICQENIQQITDSIERATDDTLIFGHFELAGFTVNNYVTKHGTIDTQLLKRFKHVYSGHYHTSSIKGNIEYVGSPYALTWNDYGDEKKFIVIDTEDPDYREMVPTKTSLFHKIIFDGTEPIVDLPPQSYLKIIVNDENNRELAEVYANNLQEKYNLSECQIIDTTESTELLEQEIENIEIDDPFQILMKSISNIKDEYVANEMMSIYKETQTMEKAE